MKNNNHRSGALFWRYCACSAREIWHWLRGISPARDQMPGTLSKNRQHSRCYHSREEARVQQSTAEALRPVKGSLPSPPCRPIVAKRFSRFGSRMVRLLLCYYWCAATGISGRLLTFSRYSTASGRKPDSSISLRLLTADTMTTVPPCRAMTNPSASWAICHLKSIGRKKHYRAKR